MIKRRVSPGLRPQRTMLVLTRQKDQSIMIGDAVELTVIDIRGDKVKLGIRAPMDVRVYRKEIYEAIHQEKLDAGGTAKPGPAKAEEPLGAGANDPQEPEEGHSADDEESGRDRPGA